MLLEFDEAKSRKNVERRGIGFERFAEMDAITARAEADVRRDYGELRLRVLGLIDGVLHAAVVTPRGERVRVISLRRANGRERGDYEKASQSS